MYAGYLYYNSTEIANNQRVVAYLNGNPALGIRGLKTPNLSLSADCGCDAIPLYCDQGSGVDGAYLSPLLDDAPWFDPDVPDSEMFAGLFIEDITGFDSVVKRDFTDGAISGGSLGPLRLAGRCMTITGWLMAKTCCGAEYGLRWLNEALMGNNFCEDCAYGDLYMLKCCPPAEDTCYTSKVGATDTVPALNVPFSITDLGGGSYSFFIDDALQTNLVSDPTGVANNANGAIPLCYAGNDTFRFVLADDVGSIFTFLTPREIVSSFITAPSGLGASLTFTVNTNIVGSCDDVVRDIRRFVTQVTEYLTVHGSAELIDTNSPTQVQCFETLPGYDPDDYKRLLHRVGLTEGPTVLERLGTCCASDCGCIYLKVEFTLCSENPYIFSDIDFCIEKERFDFDECYCFDTRRLCNVCSTQDATKFVEREVRRPNCNIEIRHDGTWCKEGWPPDVEGCPPTECLVTVGLIEEFTPEDNSETVAGTSTQKNQLFVNLNGDFTWTSVNFDVNESFPPDFADLYLFNGGNCWEPIPNPYETESGTSTCNFYGVLGPPGSYTWSPFGWNPVASGFPPKPCTILMTPSVCECPPTAARPTPPDTDPPTPDPVIDCGGGIWYNPDDCTRGCDPCGDCNPCKPDCGTDGLPIHAPIRLIWNKANNTYRFEPLALIGGAGGTTGYGDVDCFDVVEYVVEGVTPCLVRIIYDEGTGSQTWEPIHWSGTLPAPSSCDCIQIAEIVVNKTAIAGCDDTSDCPINVQCDVDYRPNIPTSREAAAAFFYRYNGSPAFIPPSPPTFPDVDENNPFFLEIEWAYAQGIAEGFGDGTFRPSDPLSRQASAAWFYRDAGFPPFIPPGIPTFPDVPVGHPFYLEIEWTAFMGIFYGYGDGTFRPTDPLLRRSAAIVFYRYAGLPPYAPTLPPYFFDVPATDPDFIVIEWMHDEGIAFGFPNSSTWQPIGWSYTEDEAFPPPNCNIFIATVNGLEQDTSPIRELIEVPYDEFVPDCGPFPSPPPPPTIFETLCYCEPWEQARKCCTFQNPADWSEATSYVDIWTGSEEMRNLKIEAYRNPFGDKVPCPCDPDDPFWECREPCATIIVPQLPARSRLIIDSRQRIAQLVLSSGRVVNALRFVFSGDGMPFQWFDIGQCSTFCIIVQADCKQTAEDAEVSIGAVGRFIASGW